MRRLRVFLLVLLLGPHLSVQLVIPPFQKRRREAFNYGQLPLTDITGPGPVLPPEMGRSPGSGSSPDPIPKGKVVLSDIMGRDKSISMFAGFVRDSECALIRLDDEAQNTTVLAPLNTEVEKLPQKPWEDPQEYGALGKNAYEGEEGIDRARCNLRRFVEEHMVPVSPWREGDTVRPVGGGPALWWEEKDGKRFIQPDDIEVVSVAGTVANGELWIIRGVRHHL